MKETNLILKEDLIMMPEPGTKEFENMVDFMRADLESGMQYSALEITVRKMLKLQGRDFEKEFKKWKKETGRC